MTLKTAFATAILLAWTLLAGRAAHAASAKDLIGQSVEAATARIESEGFKCQGWHKIFVTAYYGDLYRLGDDFTPVKPHFRPWQQREFDSSAIGTFDKSEKQVLEIPGVLKGVCENKDTGSDIVAHIVDGKVFSVSVYYSSCDAKLRCRYEPTDLGNSIANRAKDKAIDGSDTDAVLQSVLALMDPEADSEDASFSAMSFVLDSAGCDKRWPGEGGTCMIAAERDGNLFTAMSIARYGGLIDRAMGNATYRGMSVSYTDLQVELNVARRAAPIVNESIRLELEQKVAKEAEKTRKKSAGFE